MLTTHNIIIHKIMVSRSPFLVFGVVSLYWIVSISMVFINKRILSDVFGNNDLTLFIAWFQSISAVFWILTAKFIFMFTKSTIVFPSIELEALLHSDMLKTGLTFVLSLTFNNLMLKHIEVAFYQVARSFTLIFTVLLSFCMLKKSISLSGFSACALVVIGFMMGVDQEGTSGSLSIWGVIYGLIACFSTAMCGIYLRKAEAITDGSSLKLAYYNNINSSLFFFPLIYSTGQLKNVLTSELNSNMQFLILLVISGCLSLSIGWVSALQIKYTSPVSHHVSSNAKSVAQTIIAVMYYRKYKSVLWWCGNFCVVGGVLFYAYSKYKEDMKDKKAMILGNGKSSANNEGN